MAPSKSKAYSSIKSASLKSSKRKASFTPDSGTLTKRARTRQSISIEENTLVSIETPKSSKKRAKTEALAAEENPAVEISEEVPKTTSRKVKQVVIEAEEGDGNKVSPSKNKRKQKKQVKKEEEKIEEPLADEDTPKTAKRKRNTKREEAAEEREEEVGEEGTPKKVKRKRKTKEEKEAEAMPLAARTASLRMYIGAHVSSAKGVHNAVTNCVHVGGNAFALFLKSQRKWENPPLQDEHKVLFKAHCKEHKYDAESHVVPHGSYLVNLAQGDPDKANQAYISFVEDLNRCEDLGVKLYNFHPGSTGPSPRPSAIARIAKCLNRAHAATKTVKPLLENMAGGGNVIGSTFEDLHDIISLVDDKSRIGVCLDTCHSFAAGYDLRNKETFQDTLRKFDEVVGMQYLSALHLNDSKAPFNSHRDVHQNIGLGFLGLRAFHNVMNEPRFEGLPMVLETPIDSKDADGEDIEDRGIWAREIKMLEGLIGIDVESEEFGKLERELADKGEEERKKYQEQFERKVEKVRKATEKERKGMAEWLAKGTAKDGAGKESTRKKRKKKGEESEGSGQDT